MQSQANFYYRFHPTRYPFPTQRYIGETERLFGILETRLADRDYVAGSGRGKYSIADMAIWPFINAAAVAGIELEEGFPSVYKWWEQINERPAVKKGTMVPSGEEFRFGYEVVRRKMKEDPEGYEERERPLKEALEMARKEFA